MDYTNYIYIYSQVYFCFASWDLAKQVKQFFVQKVLNH